MTGRALLTSLARADFDEIWAYTEARWGTGQAAFYIRVNVAAQSKPLRANRRFGALVPMCGPATAR